MSEHSNTKLMSTSPGGETRNQYEDANSFVPPNTDQKPNFGDNKPLRGDALAQEKKTQAEKIAHHEENLQYGESISEHGFGGQTTSGQKEQEPENRHYGRDPKDEEKTELDQRKKQGYGEGSGVGA